jgi:ligand-binding sensor domain-containing protein
MSRYDGNHWASFTTANGLSSNSVYALLEDHEGYLWFGTDQGVNRYDREQFFSTLWPPGMKQGDIRAMAESTDGALWFGTESGASRYDGNLWQTYTRKEGLAHNTVYDI